MPNIRLANALAMVHDNLMLAVKIIECAEEAAEDLSPQARQGLARAYAGLAMASQGMKNDELQALIIQSDSDYKK